jgi:hypothetical protein
MEQLQAPPVSGDARADVVPSLPSVEVNAALLPDLVQRARAEPGVDGVEAQRLVDQLLTTLLPGPEHAEVLLELLEKSAFTGLVGEDGTPTRARAIAALLRQGYPWSIQVHPDDLTWYRDWQQESSRRRRLMILLGILGAELLALGALWFLL